MAETASGLAVRSPLGIASRQIRPQPALSSLLPVALGLALASLCLSGCNFAYRNPAENLGPGEVGGRTVAGVDVVVDGVAIGLKGAGLDATSRANGRFALMPLPVGKHTIVFRKGKERALQRDVEIAWGKDGQPQGVWLGDVTILATAGLGGECAIAGDVLGDNGVAVDEVSGAVVPVSAGARGAFLFEGLAVGEHRVRIFASNAAGKPHVGGPVAVTLVPGDAGTLKVLAPVALRPASTAPASTAAVGLRFSVAGNVSGLSLSDLKVTGLPVPVVFQSDGRAQVEVPEGLWTVGIQLPPSAASVTPPPLVTFVAVAGQAIDLGTLYAVTTAAQGQAALGCHADADCAPGTCLDGRCVNYTPPAQAPASAPFCGAEHRGCPVGTPLDATLPVTMTCAADPARPAVTAGVACGSCCTPDGVAVVCGTPGVGSCPLPVVTSWAVGGLVTGLTGSGLALQNGAETLPVTASGSFAFVGRLPTGASYAVTVAAQPTGQTCIVTGGTGIVGSTDVTSVTVSCTGNTYPLGGVVSGLAGSGLVLTNALLGGASEDLAITASGPFTFPTAAPAGSTFTVTVKSQPAGPAQVCTVQGGSGTLSGPVSSVAVDCVAAPPAGLAYANNPATYVAGSAIAPNAPSSTGGLVVTYDVAPPLPAGLLLDPATGVISGTPTAAAATAIYTVTAINGSGSAPVGLTITVDAAAPLVHAISGVVNGAVGNGVTITLSGAASAITSTNASALYAFTGLADGIYTVTPSLAGYAFTPASLQVQLSGADATGKDFTASVAPTTFAISGSVTGPVAAGVTMTLSGASQATTVTGAGGAFSFAGLSSGTYTLTASLLGHAFTPASSQAVVSGADVSGESFVASPVVKLCTTDLWCWESPQVVPNTLYGAWGAASGDVWAVGLQGNALHWDGVTWTEVATPASRTINSLRGLWGSSSSDVWAVGDLGTLLHWDGVKWSSATSPTTNNLTWVWGSSASDVWAVGGGGVGATNLHHWNGTAWSVVPNGAVGYLFSVWGSSSTDVWAVGLNGSMIHWDGTAWTGVTSGAFGTLFSVWGSSSTDVWAVGDFQTILHWNGSSWSSVTNPATLGAFSGVWGTSPTDIWVVGSNIILHWDGSAWSSLQPGTAARLNGVWGTSAKDVWVLGDDTFTSAMRGTLLHWDGTAWSTASEWSGRGTTPTLSAVTGGWSSSSSDAWLASGGTAIWRWNGSTLTSVATPAPGGLSVVWGSSATDVWAVGSSGSFAHWDGAAWSNVASGTTKSLYSIWGSGANDVWAVGASGTIVHWDGIAWSTVASGTTVGLNGVWGLSATDAWAVGGGIRHWDGTAWTAMTTPMVGQENAVWGSSASDLWVVLSGVIGTPNLYHYDGSAWTGVTSGTTADLVRIWGRSATDVWIVGYGGTILHWDGITWSSSESGTSNTLGALWGSPSGDTWVGGSITLLHHGP